MGMVKQDDGWRLPDRLWAQMEQLLPPRKPHLLGCHHPRVRDRAAMDAILFVLRTGCQWNALNGTGICSSSSPGCRTQRSTWVSVVLNIVLSAVQAVAGIWAGSQALVADAIHSLSDLVSDFVVLVAGHYSRKDVDADHAYGHQRYENAASLVLGGLLLAVGVGMLWAAVQKIQAPHSVSSVHLIALWVALAALAAKELLFRYMLAVATRLRSSLLIANAWHARSDAASSLVVALGIGGNLLGFSLLDPIAALIVGLMVSKMGWGFFWSALHDLMDRAVSAEESAAIAATLRATPGVLGIHDMRTRKMGDMTLVDVHLEINAHQSVAEGHDIAVLARRRVLDAHRVLNVMTHVDPVK